MKHLIVLLLCSAAVAATDDPAGRMLNEKLTAAQRNDACFALRGNRSPQVIAAMRAALASDPVRTCAGRNLREAGAVEELKSALAASQPEIRAMAARELGAMKLPELIEPLFHAAHDSNALVAANAVMALGQYHDRAVLARLLELANGGGLVGVAALSQAGQLDEAATLPIARRQLEGNDLPEKLLAVKIVGDLGGPDDLPLLRDLAAKSSPTPVRGRGFGLMPALDIGRAARGAIAEIEKRQHGAG